MFVGAVVENVNVPVRAPRPVGLKVTLMVHDVVTPPIQLLVWKKSEGFNPVIDTLLTTTGAVPVLVMVTTWAMLLVETSCGAKLRVIGETVMSGAAPTWDTFDHGEES